MKPVRVVLVDDHKVVRQGIRFILDPDPRFEVVGEAGSGEEALRVLSGLEPDAVILDLHLPDAAGAEVCQRIVELYPKTAVLILTAFVDRQLVGACLRAGARGYLLKDGENLPLAQQILAAVRGQTPLDPRAAGIVTDLLLQHEPPSDELSLREIEVLKLISHNLTNREIGAELYISVNTVKQHVKKILAKLEARNRFDAVRKARERNLL
ncbi:MAG: response regulator transcription factor [Anaerolineales bacterium]|nr:response regulator transcription factor [Anaerolineales bacterium]